MFSLGANNYGKSECRLVRVIRDGPRHEVVDLNVTTSLSGDFTDTYLTGDNTKVLATDTQKNTVYALAGEQGFDAIEEFGLLLARHFVTTHDPVHSARVRIEQYSWHRSGDHSFVRQGDAVRSATVTFDGRAAEVSGGLHDLTLMNTTGSEFGGFPRDRYTTLTETTDRILATAVNAEWRFDGVSAPWNAAYATVRDALTAAFSETYSRSLQQTLYAMGCRALESVPELTEIRLSLPNKHHFLVDLSPFGLDNPDAVYFAADRPYGLIEGTVRRAA